MISYLAELLGFLFFAFKKCSLTQNSDRHLTQFGRDYDRRDSGTQSRMRFFISGAGYNGEVAEVRAYYGDRSAGVDEFYR
jgi:hypothetical protein